MGSEVTLKAASYRWVCPECGEEHFVAHVTNRVTCSACGSILEVGRVEHRQAGSMPSVPDGLTEEREAALRARSQPLLLL